MNDRVCQIRTWKDRKGAWAFEVTFNGEVYCRDFGYSSAEAALSVATRHAAEAEAWKVSVAGAVAGGTPPPADRGGNEHRLDGEGDRSSQVDGAVPAASRLPVEEEEEK